ncbi:integrase, catalytic region, zinc finger, CCHC-type containing protein [Tanacetum coccineum]
MEKLENENVSLEFQFQSLVKERENMKLEYQKLFDSIKKIRSQTQMEINELIKSVNQKTYAYGDVRLKGVNSVRRPSARSSSSKNSVLSNTKIHSEAVQVYAKKNKKTNVTSRMNVVKTKKHVENVDTKNALKAKIDVLCVSCEKNVLTSCHDKCLAKYKFSVKSNVRRALFSTPRIVKFKFVDTTPVVAKTRFVVVTPLSAKNKDSCASRSTLLFKSVDTTPVLARTSLGHNLFSVGQFCDDDLEVSFRSKTCYIPNLEGEALLTGAHDSNLYTISISDMEASSSVCFLYKATSTKSWLWHRRFSHLNFGTINHLTKQDLVDGLLKFKYDKDHMCSAWEQGKSKKASLQPKLVPSTHSKLELIHMDLYGPMRLESIKDEKYILVIIDDYSRYAWVYFLCTKYEAPDMIIKFITRVQLKFKVDEVTWKTYGGNTCDLGSIIGETGQEYNFTQKGLKNYSQKVETAPGLLATPSGLSNDGVREFVTASRL